MSNCNIGLNKFFSNFPFAVFKGIVFIKNNFIIILILFVLGSGLGSFIDKYNYTYDNQIIVTPNLSSVDYLYNKIDLLSSKLKENDKVFFKSIGVNSEIISSIEIEPIIDVYSFINDSKPVVNVQNTQNFELVKLLSESGDINKVIKHKGERYILFGGSDVNYTYAINKLKKLNNIIFISISKCIHARLNKNNIPNILINFSLIDTNIFKPIPKEELGNCIFIYNGYYKNLEHNYGKEYYEQVMKLLPNYEYILSNTLNEPYTNMPNIYKKCFIILRLTSNDGNANTIQEAEALGIPAIHNQSEYGLKWETVDDIINYIININ